MPLRLSTIVGLVASVGCKPPASNPTVNMRYVDRNNDGLVDVMQIDHNSEQITAWIDDNYDGRFDRQIEEVEGKEQSSTKVNIQVPRLYR